MRVTHNIVFVIIIIDRQSDGSSDGSSLVINHHLQMDAWWGGMAAWSELPRRSCCCLLPLGSLYSEPFSRMIARMMTMTMMMMTLMMMIISFPEPRPEDRQASNPRWCCLPRLGRRLCTEESRFGELNTNTRSLITDMISKTVDYHYLDRESGLLSWLHY